MSISPGDKHRNGRISSADFAKHRRRSIPSWPKQRHLLRAIGARSGQRYYVEGCWLMFSYLCRDISVLCRMKMLPVMILAKYHSSARSAVSESSNSSARLVSQCPNSSARLVSQCPNSSARLVFRMFQVELATRF